MGPEGKAPGDPGFVFAVHNVNDPRCGRPPRLRNTDHPSFCYGYFENRHGEQFVFTFDRATGAGTVCRGTLGCAEPQSVTLDLLSANRVLRTQPRTLSPPVPAIGS